MKCEEFKEHISALVEPDRYTPEMVNHLLECPACTEYYRGAKAALDAVTPRLMPSAPVSLLHNVRSEIVSTSGKLPVRNIRLNRRLSRIAIAASVGVVAVTLLITGLMKPAEASAASATLGKALESIGQIKNMVMKLNVRSEPRETFTGIEQDAEMMPYTLTTLLEPSLRWRVEKESRTAVFDGKSQYMWTPSTAVTAGPNVGFLDWFSTLVDPRETLSKAKAAVGNPGTKITIDETGSEIRLTLQTTLDSVERRSYGANESIESSDSRSEYVFDKPSYRIKSLKIYLLESGRENLILETTDIAYNVPLLEEQVTALPADRDWANLMEPVTNKQFVGISAEKAARLIFEAMSERRSKDIREVFSGTDPALFDKGYGGVRIISIGKPFESVLFINRKFVPYEIEFPDGKVKKHNLALRHDNPAGSWVVDGGL